MSARLLVVAEEDGAQVARFELDHGADPVGRLRSRGLAVVGSDHPLAEVIAPARSVTADPGPPWTITVTYAVRRVGGSDPADGAGASAPVSRDEGLTDEDVAGARRHQRVASYAVVRSPRGLLLTELSERTNAAGQWTLPGGGLDEGEAPLTGLHREVWEESGQTVVDVAFLGVQTSHWVGRSPTGAVEDFHAVRLIHTARCPAPTEPVIHDVGGSTSAARWVPGTGIGRVPLVGSFAPLIRVAAGQHPAEG